LGAKNNTELLANLGNFVNRCLKFTKDRLESLVPAPGNLNDDDKALIAEVNEQLAIYVHDMDELKLKAGLHVAMNISRLGNAYLQKQEPWVLIKADKTRCDTVIYVGLNLVKLLTILLEPFIPHFTEKVLRQLGLPHAPIPDKWVLDLPVKHFVLEAVPIFREITEQELTEFSKRFAGQQKK